MPSRDATTVSTRVPKAEADAFTASAERRGLTPSAALRRLMARQVEADQRARADALAVEAERRRVRSGA